MAKTAPNLPRHEAKLPQAGPEPVFQMASGNSRFGFSATPGISNLSQNVSNHGQHLQVIRSNPTHSNIDDNSNNDNSNNDSSSDDSSSDDDDSDLDMYVSDKNNGDDYNDNGGNECDIGKCLH